MHLHLGASCMLSYEGVTVNTGKWMMDGLRKLLLISFDENEINGCHFTILMCNLPQILFTLRSDQSHQLPGEKVAA